MEQNFYRHEILKIVSILDIDLTSTIHFLDL